VVLLRAVVVLLRAVVDTMDLLPSFAVTFTAMT